MEMADGDVDERSESKVSAAILESTLRNACLPGRFVFVHKSDKTSLMRDTAAAGKLFIPCMYTSGPTFELPHGNSFVLKAIHFWQFPSSYFGTRCSLPPLVNIDWTRLQRWILCDLTLMPSTHTLNTSVLHKYACSTHTYDQRSIASAKKFTKPLNRTLCSGTMHAPRMKLTTDYVQLRWKNHIP